MAFTTLTTTVLKISGLSTSAGSTINAGRSITTARLTTIDEDSGPIGPLQLNSDPYSLFSGEALSVLINGQKVASQLPSLYATSIVTNAGTFTGFAFSVGGDTYFLTRTGVDTTAITSLIQPAVLNNVPASLPTASAFGFIPENANTFTGQALTVTNQSSSNPGTVAVVNGNIYDADRVRGNADSVGEEVGTGALSRIGEAQEIRAVLTFKDGTTLSSVEGVVQTVTGAYGYSQSTYLFNETDLAGAGKTLADIAGVASTASFNHALNWEELGFDFTAAGNGIITSDPAASPPANEIFGTSAKNTLTGTAGRDAIHGLGGNDTLTGGAGNDGFFFGAETRNGRREVDIIRDYEVGKDSILFEDAALVQSVANINGGVRITFAGDGDRVDVFGSGLNKTNISIFADELFV
jgi:Ca2+-binding RTX toxin-like protein